MHQNSHTTGQRIAALAAMGMMALGGLGLAACGSESEKPAAAAPTTSTAVAVTPPGEFNPADHVAPEHRQCFVDAMQHDAGDAALFACLDRDDMVAIQRAYLDQETDATDAQIDCVVQRMDSLSLDKLRAAASHVGQAFYVPCGLPD